MNKQIVFIFTLFFNLFVLFSCTETVKKNAVCEVGRIYCINGQAAECVAPEGKYSFTDCSLYGKICVASSGCRMCKPGAFTCQDQTVSLCSDTGNDATPLYECDGDSGYVCSFGQCINACEKAEEERSYLGCEYWAADLDNAVVSSGSAAAQQYSVVVSNPGNVTAHVKVERNTAPPGWNAVPEVVTETDVPPEGLRIINLPSAEVDGSPEGTFNNGTDSALTSRAYKITSNVPIAAYQFNPLANYQVFSNDASILFPKNALDTSYLVLSWPQTIADTNDPNNDFQEHLRAFLTVIAVEPGTDVTITLSTDIKGDGNKIPDAGRGETLHFDLNEFDVLNLETNGFLADFTGTEVISDKPIVVFTGSEASDVPVWHNFSERQCCADHLEHQLFPNTAAGTKFVAARIPPRTTSVNAAGGECPVIEESDIFRIMALYDNTTVFTTKPAPDNYFYLSRGEYVDVDPYCDMVIESDKPVFVGQFSKGQGSTAIPLELPGGDPSFIMVPPVEQWRNYYVFLTPDKYAFDFITLVAEMGADIKLDYLDLDNYECTRHVASCSQNFEDGNKWEVINCQLSFPVLFPGKPPGENIDPGIQNDGYHVLKADKPFGLIVSGFDKHVSYGYVGGMDMKRINIE